MKIYNKSGAVIPDLKTHGCQQIKVIYFENMNYPDYANFILYVTCPLPKHIDRGRSLSAHMKLPSRSQAIEVDI
jgi:hypothetical protein